MKKILLIEDNDDIRDNTAEILELSNYEVIVAENGKVGVAKAIEHEPDLIICDIMMPEIGGYELLRLLKQNSTTANIPFIFASASVERKEIQVGKDLGANGYLCKPFSQEELVKELERWLGK